MNKSELVDKIAEDTGKPIAHARDSLDAVLEAIAAELVAGGEVKLTGFGNFKMVMRSAKEGRNPKTGESIKIPPRAGIKFAAGAPLLSRIR